MPNDSDPTQSEPATTGEFRITRLFDAPPARLYRAWTTPEEMQEWWVPAGMGMTLQSCQIDARPGGGYRFTFTHPDFPAPMAFFGRYLHAIPPTRLVWTNEESPDGAVTTVTFTPEGTGTRLTLTECYPSPAAADAALASGSLDAYPLQFEQLAAHLTKA